MTLNELIQRLTDIRDDWDVSGDTPVLGAFQPNYPLVADIAAITTIMDANEVPTIYIAISDGSNYGNSLMYSDDVVEGEDGDEDED
jgi:hypothetical protein